MGGRGARKRFRRSHSRLGLACWEKPPGHEGKGRGSVKFRRRLDLVITPGAAVARLAGALVDPACPEACARLALDARS
jgi:hypothetical protein